MAGDEVFGHPELASHAAHLVLEQPLQRLAELEVHLLGQSAHIMMALDDHPGDAEALDAVGVDGALGKPFGVGDFLGFGVEHVDEAGADDLALALGFSDAFQFTEELLAGIHADDVEAETLIVAHHVLELVFAEQAVIDEDASEVFADGAVEQYGAHGGIHAAGEAEDDAVVADLLFQFGHGGVHEGGGAPGLVATADAHHEVLEQLGALGGVEHFGVELHAPYGLVLKLVGGVFHLVGGGNLPAVVGKFGDGVAVAHPDLRVRVEALEQGVVMVELSEVGAAVLAAAGGLHASAIGVGHILGAVADAEDGQASADGGEIYLEGLLVIDAEGRAAEDDADDVGVVVREFVVGHDFAEHIEFADPAADELCGLGTEVKNDDFLHRGACFLRVQR